MAHVGHLGHLDQAVVQVHRGHQVFQDLLVRRVLQARLANLAHQELELAKKDKKASQVTVDFLEEQELQGL